MEELLGSFTTKYPFLGSVTVDKNETDTYSRIPPNRVTFLLYCVVIPIMGIFGMFANFINGIVFMRPRMKPSAFTYLAALSWIDCLSCLFIMLTGYSRSFFYKQVAWVRFDFQWQTPLFGITTGAANLILVCLTCDRLAFLLNPLPNRAPKMCSVQIARRLVCAIILFSALLNIPYFFIFVVNDDGTFNTTNFYYSTYYVYHNWITFVILGAFPGVLLIIGNGALIIIFVKWTKKTAHLRKQTNVGHRRASVAQKKYMDQTKLITTIVIVVILFLIGELPAQLTSRKSALNLLFGGDISKVDFVKMEKIEVYLTTLNAIQLSLNIVIYAVINPSFMVEFFQCLKESSDCCCRVCWCNRKLKTSSDDEDDCPKKKRVFIVSQDDTSKGDSFFIPGKSDDCCGKTKETGLSCCNCNE